MEDASSLCTWHQIPLFHARAETPAALAGIPDALKLIFQARVEIPTALRPVFRARVGIPTVLRPVFQARAGVPAALR